MGLPTGDNLLKVQEVSKRFGERFVVDHVSFNVSRGEVVGFIGPNGAGKSTTMKMICGLLKLGSGSISLDGFNLCTESRKFLSRLGALIESPGFYPSLSAYQHLALIARLRKCFEPKLLCQTLDKVGLDTQSKKPVQQFSTGMKQRLGIAMAILHRPSLLILDEPMNGLDPVGMVAIRELLKAISRDNGVSVFVSSHLLHEIEQVCDRVLFLKDGRLSGDRQLCQPDLNQAERVWLRTGDNARAAELLAHSGLVREVKVVGDGLACAIATSHISGIVALLVNELIEVYEVTPRPETLEDLYLSKYGNQVRDKVG